MTEETKIKSQIKDLLNFRGIFWWHNLQGIGSKKGLPDMFVLRGGKLYGIEVKAPKGHLTKWQVDFLAEMMVNGGITIVARSVEDVIRVLKL